MIQLIKQSTSLTRKWKRGDHMLVLTRKLGESITIGDHIEITVLETKGDQVKLGIQAPKDIDIYRKEVYGHIQNENKRALNTVEQLKQILENK